MPPLTAGGHDLEGHMSKRTDATCNDCYFRQKSLCALATETPCPTFRLMAGRGLTPPRQAQLVPLVRDANRDRERDEGLRPAFV